MCAGVAGLAGMRGSRAVRQKTDRAGGNKPNALWLRAAVTRLRQRSQGRQLAHRTDVVVAAGDRGRSDCAYTRVGRRAGCALSRHGLAVDESGS